MNELYRKLRICAIGFTAVLSSVSLTAHAQYATDTIPAQPLFNFGEFDLQQNAHKALAEEGRKEASIGGNLALSAETNEPASAGVVDSNRPFTVNHVPVDETAKDATRARKAAVSAGEKLAFYKLIKNYFPGVPISMLPNINERNISRMLLGYEVEEERISKKRYRALITYTFNPDSMRSLITYLSQSDAVKYYSNVEPELDFGDTSDIDSPSDIRSAKLILPILHNENDTLLWENNNSWKTAWEQLKQESYENAFTVPTGDAVDVASVQTLDLLVGNFTQNTIKGLQQLANKYAAKEIIIAELRRSSDVPGDKGFKVQMRTVSFEDKYGRPLTDSAVVNDPETMRFTPTTPDSPIEYLTWPIAKETLARIKQEQNQQQEFSKSIHNTKLRIAVNSMQSWSNLQSQFEQMDIGQKFTINGFSSRFVDATYTHWGTASDLAEFLNSQGFSTHMRGDLVVVLSNQW